MFISQLNSQSLKAKADGAGARRWRRLKKPTSFKEVVKIVSLLKQVGEPLKPKTELLNSIVLLLTETPTAWLLDLKSSGIVVDENIEAAASMNTANLDQIGSRKEKGTHCSDSSVQIIRMNEKQKMTQTQQVSEEDKLVFATEWDLYDTYRKLTSDADTETRLKGTSGSHNDAEIFQASECKRAVAIMQRLLASNNFHEEQALFMGLQKQKKFQTEF
ncbi:uncharacterized protein [Bemisia tabaci]|uniref:uncharacterized protein isoform X5 n=1 Tax=Bemisia tabaci TaxID=7038 RepID=UPI003B27E80C